MTEEQAAIELDEEILEAALTILDGGARPTLEELAPRFPGLFLEVECVPPQAGQHVRQRLQRTLALAA